MDASRLIELVILDGCAGGSRKKFAGIYLWIAVEVPYLFQQRSDSWSLPSKIFRVDIANTEAGNNHLGDIDRSGLSGHPADVGEDVRHDSKPVGSEDARVRCRRGQEGHDNDLVRRRTELPDRTVKLITQQFHVIEQLRPFSALCGIVGVNVAILPRDGMKEDVRLAEIRDVIGNRHAIPVRNDVLADLKQLRGDVNIGCKERELLGPGNRCRIDDQLRSREGSGATVVSGEFAQFDWRNVIYGCVAEIARSESRSNA
jgi:hypothetical protein